MGHPPLRLYEQQTTPRSANAPYLRAVDVSGGENSIASALSRAGQALEGQARTLTDIDLIEAERRRDDARATVAQTMARARFDAGEIRRQAETEAPNGWQGLTDTVAARWSERSQGYLAEEGLTDEAREYLGAELEQFQWQVLDNTAESETANRRAWRSDTVNQATDQYSGVLAADPTQWQEVRDSHVALIGSMQDLTADQRRDLSARAEGEFAVSAVSGYVERDPYGALTALRDPEATGPYAQLTGPQRAAFENRAQAEINRRQSEARAQQAQAVASLRDTVSAQNQLLQRGIMPSAPVDPQVIASALGPDVAQNYIANLASASAAQGMATMPSAQVAQIAAGAPSADNSDIGNLVTVEARNAAQSVLTQRREDPGGYALRNGLMRQPDLMSVIGQATNSGDWSGAATALEQRGADAVDLRRRGVTAAVAPLSSGEASALAQWLAQQPAQNRLAFFSQAARAMNRDAYSAMMVQIAPNGGEINAYAGFRYRENPDLSRRLMRGAELLQGGRPGEDGQRRPLIDLPEESWLREQWEARVGSAYAGIPGAAESAYATFRASYAARSESEGDTAASQSAARARAAVGDATGGVTRWSGRDTLMPAGMTSDQFEQGVARGFQQWSFLQGVNPRDYDLIAIGGGRYLVDGVRNPVSGQPVEIQVRR